MAYNQGQGRGNGNYQNTQRAAPAAPRAGAPATGTGTSNGGEKKEFVEDPNKVGIAYEKTMKTGENYFSVTMTRAVEEGAKLSIFPNNKVKNRTEKTPTHVIKLAKKPG